MWWWISGGVLLALTVAYILLTMWSAKHDIETAPRADMVLCEKHGAFPAKYQFHLTGMTKEPLLICPMCLEDRFKSARSNR
jgi:hypothetical protein